MRFVLILALFASAACVPPGPLATVASSRTLDDGFHETVRAHVAAIQARELEKLMATVTTGDSLTLIFPEGEILHTRDQYVAFHRTWFADTSWTMDMQLESMRIWPNFGVALLRATYTDPAGSRRALVALTFAREPGGWRLVFDQNTRVVQR